MYLPTKQELIIESKKKEHMFIVATDQA